MQRALLLALVASLAVAGMGPATAQDAGADRETSTVTFYGHVFGHGVGTPMPANTAKPLGEDNYGIGGTASCTSLDATGAVVGSCRDTTFNTLALFSTAGFVDVKNRAEFLQNGEYALFHNERGQTKDIVLDPARNIEATVFFTMDGHGWFVGAGNPYGTNCAGPHPPDVPCLYPSWGWDPGVFQDVMVEATLYAANLGDHGGNASDAPPIAQALDSGEATVIATGTWGPETVMNGVPGAPNVNQVTVDLGPPMEGVIVRNQDFFLVYRILQETGGQDYLIDGPVRWWSGDLFPPSFTLPVKNAFDVERVIPNFAHGKMALLAVMNTPWGSYDLDPNSVTLEVQGPAGAVEPANILRFGDVSVAHGGHYLPINLTWVWDVQADGLRAGTYEVTVSAANFQHSATASCTASFTLGKAANGRLYQESAEDGVCGIQTASDDFLDELTEGALNGG